MAELDQRSLAQLMREPEVHRELVGSSKAQYSLGLVKDPSFEGWGLLLRIADVGDDEIRRISIGGRVIPVLVRYRFEPPKALAE